MLCFAVAEDEFNSPQFKGFTRVDCSPLFSAPPRLKTNMTAAFNATTEFILTQDRSRSDRFTKSHNACNGYKFNHPHYQTYLSRVRYSQSTSRFSFVVLTPITLSAAMLFLRWCINFTSFSQWLCYNHHHQTLFSKPHLIIKLAPKVVSCTVDSNCAQTAWTSS